MLAAMSTRTARPAALARAQHDARPAHLTTAERRTLEEALRRGQDMADEVELQVMAFGRWLLEAIFANDAAAALDDKASTPVWLELVRRAGGPSLRVSRHMLYTAVQLAARDRRIGDQAWQNLDAPRKELLLPLKDDRKIREAAQHVSKFNLTQPKTREYVTALLAGAGRARQVRVTAPAIAGRVRALRESLDSAAVLRRVKALELDAAQRAALAGELDRLREVLATLSRVVRRR